MEQSQFEMVLDRDVFRKALGLFCGRLDKDILPIEAQAFVCDLGCVDLDRSQ